MGAPGQTSILVQQWLNRLDEDTLAGEQARNELIEHGKRRMEALCRKMFFPSLHSTAVVDLGDVYQESAIRLWQALQTVKPNTVKEFFGLAAKKIREVSVDLCRKYLKEPPQPVVGDESSFSPETLSQWTEFHEVVEKLDEPLREVVDLLWYQDLTQREAAEILELDESTVKRRWRRARQQLARHLT